MNRSFVFLCATASALALSGCNAGSNFKLSDYNPFKAQGSAAVSEGQAIVDESDPGSVPTLKSMIGSASAGVNVDAGFVSAMREALVSDPFVTAAKSEAAARKANVRVTTSGKDFNFDATLLAGVEDVTDETAGVAAILSAKRVLFDGGKIDAQIAKDTFAAQSAENMVRATQNERAVKLAHAWIDLERYRDLQNLIDSRLEVLDPLLVQLEEVANSGMGDASQIAAAQRTVSLIRVTQTDVPEKYEQAKVNFINLFGKLPRKTAYDSQMLAKALPKGSAKSLAESSPALLAKYDAYRSAEAGVTAVEALDKFSVGFEAKMQKPFGASGYASDESIGLVVRKTFYKGDQLTSRIENAQAAAEAQAEQVRSTYREGERGLASARQMIISMGKAVELSRANAQISRDEIAYLRKQLIIGGSTLDAVLAAEARLYDAESKEIGFVAERRKAEATILGITGKLDQLLGL